MFSAPGCSDDDLTASGGAEDDDEESEDSEDGDDEGVVDDEGETGEEPEYSVRGSILQVYLWHAEPEAEFELIGPDGQTQQSGTTDQWGSLVYRDVAPAAGYLVRRMSDGYDSEEIEVLAKQGSEPDQSFYDNQVLEEGFGYLTARDGTKLSVFVSLPGPAEDGPYPTIVNYSGYSPSRPGRPIDVGFPVDTLCEDYPVLCNAPDHPSGMIGGVLGFASVGVNMRGTGCSAGAYDYFDAVQLTDGYDIIEIVAAQPWVKHGHVGMAGLSYPGISQLFVATMRPPHLAAITPLSVISEVQATLVPGGILNDGFAIEWADRVLDNAGVNGQGWSVDLIENEGDEVCAENQLLHDQKLDIIAKAYANPFYDPEVADPLNLTLQAPDINVPVFLTGQWQDEQTGPGFASMLGEFESSPQARFTVFNGVHPDGYGPQTLTEWFNFLSFYVDEEIPVVPLEVRNLAPLLFQDQFGASSSLPDDRFADYTDFNEALADYEAEPKLRALFEMGADGGTSDGYPVHTMEASFSQWPPQETVATRFYLQADGTLDVEMPTDNAASSKWEHDPEEGQKINLNDGGDPWDLQPDYNWAAPDSGRAIAFESADLSDDLVMLGHASLDLWIQSTADDADIEVSLVEVRPDGSETYVQSGWLRASLRHLDAGATELKPTKTFLEADAEPLPEGEWTEARVEIFAFSHIFRAGSRIRIIIDTPGNSRARWRFALKDYPEGTEVSVAHDAEHPSSVVLPVIEGLTPNEPLAECGVLRGQPCRDYATITNVAGL